MNKSNSNSLKALKTLKFADNKGDSKKIVFKANAMALNSERHMENRN